MVALTWRVSQSREAARAGGQRGHRGQRETRYTDTEGPMAGWGSGLVSPQGAPEDAALALHWGIPPHISPLSCSSPVCMPMVPTWL